MFQSPTPLLGPSSARLTRHVPATGGIAVGLLMDDPLFGPPPFYGPQIVHSSLSLSLLGAGLISNLFLLVLLLLLLDMSVALLFVLQILVPSI